MLNGRMFPSNFDNVSVGENDEGLARRLRGHCTQHGDGDAAKGPLSFLVRVLEGEPDVTSIRGAAWNFSCSRWVVNFNRITILNRGIIFCINVVVLGAAHRGPLHDDA